MSKENIAEKEMKIAENALEVFKQESKVFAPDSQLNSLIGQLNEVDKSITNTRVNIEIRYKQMELLDDGNSASIFNSGEYTAATEVRKALVGKQIALKSQLQ